MLCIRKVRAKLNFQLNRIIHKIKNKSLYIWLSSQDIFLKSKIYSIWRLYAITLTFVGQIVRSRFALNRKFKVECIYSAYQTGVSYEQIVMRWLIIEDTFCRKNYTFLTR